MSKRHQYSWKKARENTILQQNIFRESILNLRKLKIRLKNVPVYSKVELKYMKHPVNY